MWQCAGRHGNAVFGDLCCSTECPHNVSCSVLCYIILVMCKVTSAANVLMCTG